MHMKQGTFSYQQTGHTLAFCTYVISIVIACSILLTVFCTNPSHAQSMRRFGTRPKLKPSEIARLKSNAYQMRLLSREVLRDRLQRSKKPVRIRRPKDDEGWKSEIRPKPNKELKRYTIRIASNYPSDIVLMGRMFTENDLEIAIDALEDFGYCCDDTDRGVDYAIHDLQEEFGIETDVVDVIDLRNNTATAINHLIDYRELLRLSARDELGDESRWRVLALLNPHEPLSAGIFIPDSLTTHEQRSIFGDESPPADILDIYLKKSIVGKMVNRDQEEVEEVTESIIKDFLIDTSKGAFFASMKKGGIWLKRADLFRAGVKELLTNQDIDRASTNIVKIVGGSLLSDRASEWIVIRLERSGFRFQSRYTRAYAGAIIAWGAKAVFYKSWDAIEDEWSTERSSH